MFGTEISNRCAPEGLLNVLRQRGKNVRYFLDKNKHRDPPPTQLQTSSPWLGYGRLASHVSEDRLNTMFLAIQMERSCTKFTPSDAQGESSETDRLGRRLYIWNQRELLDTTEDQGLGRIIWSLSGLIIVGIKWSSTVITHHILLSSESAAEGLSRTQVKDLVGREFAGGTSSGRMGCC